MMESLSTKFVAKTGYEYEVFELSESFDGFETSIEVCDADGEWYSEIGIWTDKDKRLTDYDGVFCLSWNAIRALRKSGITVPRDYELDLQGIEEQD